MPTIGAISKNLSVSADAVANPSAQTRAESRVLDLRKRLRKRDRLSAGGRWIRTFGPPSEGQRFRGSQSELPGRLVMPTRGQQSIGPQLGRASWAGARRSRFLLKANCGDRTRAAKSCFFMGSNPRSGSAEARVYPHAEGARPQRSAQDASLWSSKPLFRSHRNG